MKQSPTSCVTWFTSKKKHFKPLVLEILSQLRTHACALPDSAQVRRTINFLKAIIEENENHLKMSFEVLTEPKSAYGDMDAKLCGKE